MTCPLWLDRAAKVVIILGGIAALIITVPA